MAKMAEAMNDCYGRVPLLEMLLVMLKKYKKDSEIAGDLLKALKKLRSSRPQK